MSEASLDPGEFLRVDEEKLAALPLVERVRVLTELMTGARSWLSERRGLAVEELRESLPSDYALAKVLGVTRQAVSIQRKVRHARQVKD